MSDWNYERLSKLCFRIGDGLHGTPSYVEDSGIYFINGNNLKNGWIEITNNTKCVSQEELKNNFIELNENSLLLSINGTLGSMAFYRNEKVMLGKSSAYLNFKSPINKFYYYYFQLPFVQEYFFNVATGSTIKNLSLKSIQDFEVPVPEFNVWNSIASVLSALDSKIEINNRINAELEAMAKTLYDYWFVQFDFPIYNQDGTLSGAEGYKTTGGTLVWNEELKREIPEGWEVKKIGKILKTSLGGTPSTKVKEYWENGRISWLNSGEIANFPIIDSESKITEAAIKNSATDLLPKGSVMLSITRHLRPSILGIDACANQSVIGILEKDNIKCYFLYPYLQNEIPRLMEMRSGAQQPHINKEIVDESFILLPNNETEILKKYNAQVGHFYELIINNAFQNQKLTELRDWLLPMLMNGQVKVSEL
jgi:type I restriction enzyme S subunit